ncbi:unnamed protein product [Alternaria alternata]
MGFTFSISAILIASAIFVGLVDSASIAISRSGWTATSDSFQAGNEPYRALDGNGTSFWHSKYEPAPVDPLPNWIIVDMKSSYNVNAVSLQPRPSDNANGRIGGHKIEVSSDNTSWQIAAVGTYNNDASTKKTFFVPRPARYIRITATSEAQNNVNQWTVIAGINIFEDTTYAPPAAGMGLWEKTVNFPLIPAAAALLPNGKVLMWSAFAKDNFGGQRGFTQTGIYDPATGESMQLEVSNTQHDMFCPGISMDFNGRVIVTGGSDAAKTSVYDPLEGAWNPGSNMRIARGYQSTTTCSDGRIFNIGGSWSGGTGGKNGEIYNPTSNAWTLLQNALVSPMLTADRGGVWRSDNHAWLFGWKNQSVFQAGPSIAMNWYDTVGAGSTTGAGNRLDDGHAMNGNAVMFDATAGKILTAGGAADYENSDGRTNAL